MKLKKTLTTWLTTPYKMVIRNEEDLAEKSVLQFNYAKIITLGFFAVLVLMGLGLLLSYSILYKWFNTQSGGDKIAQLYTTVTQLEQHNAEQENFIQTFQNALGTNPDNTGQMTDDLPTPVTQKDLANPDVPLASEPNQLSQDDLYPAVADLPVAPETLKDAAYTTSSNQLSYLSLITPLEGSITTRFDLQMGHYGLDIVGKEEAPIKAIADGRVILATWTVEAGWLIMLQHAQSWVSVYKHNATLFKNEGHGVKAGEVIALMGNSGEFSTGPHLHFELWHNGDPINPEDFIIF